jgi:uncharacterized FlaG/YvyC family protein
MNIKSLANIFTATPVIKRSEVAQRMKSEASADRDANAQYDGGQDGEKRSLTAEELELALQHLRALSGVKDNHLQVTVREQDGLKVIFIEDPTGKVIRRIPEWDLLALLKNRSNSPGQLLNKAM